MKYLVLLLSLFGHIAFSAIINMQERHIHLNQSVVEKVIVKSESEVLIRAIPLPCPYYPEGIYGDLYECTTTLEQLSKLLQKNEILHLSSKDLQRFLVESKYQFTCNAKFDPVLINYQGKKVHYFTGPIKSVQ